MNRRKLLTTTALGLTALTSTFIAACSKKEEGGASSADKSKDNATPESNTAVNFVSESDTVAQSLGYKEDASAVDSSVRADKGDTKGAEQFCTNCRFYTADESVEGGGKCTLFPGKYVKGAGWCKSWSLVQS